jgi:hypothetical protein
VADVIPLTVHGHVGEFDDHARLSQSEGASARARPWLLGVGTARTLAAERRDRCRYIASRSALEGSNELFIIMIIRRAQSPEVREAGSPWDACARRGGGVRGGLEPPQS